MNGAPARGMGTLVARGLPAVLLAAVLSGCGGSLEPYETESGSATRLDGTKAAVQALTVSEAVLLRPQKPVYVRGYLLAPWDDERRLCTRLKEGGDCRGAPFLVLDVSKVNLDVARALEAGCCSLGLWSPHPLVLRLQFQRERRVLVLG
jgi:hypothetical protein